MSEGLSPENDNTDKKTGKYLDFANLAAKFGEYRSKVELIGADYRQSKDVIDRLRDDINILRETEKYYQLQLSSLQGRFNTMEDRRKTLSAYSERIKSHEQTIIFQGEKLNTIASVIEEIKFTLENIKKKTENEIHIVRRNRELMASLTEKETVLSLLKEELKSTQTSKDDIINQYASENEALKEEVRVLKLDMLEKKSYCDRVINSYRKQVEAYENTIQQMEMERRSILGDFEVFADPKEKAVSMENIKNDKGPWPDSTVGCFTKDRENDEALTQKMNLSAQSPKTYASKSMHSQSNSTSDESQLNLNPKLTSSKFPKLGSRQKPKLDFRNTNWDSSQSETKRRLYSPNSNYLF